MAERQVYFNGEFVPESQAKISIYDSALMFGDMIFEMTRSFNKEQFKLKEHIDRLYNSAKFIELPMPITKDHMYDAVMETIEINDPRFEDDDEHRIMIDVTRGILGIYQGVVGVKPQVNIIIADFPLRWTVSSMGHLFTKGINAVITSQRAIPARYLDPKIKNRSRLHYLMANIEASKIKGEDNWALLLDDDGFIAEGTGDNFFIVKQGVVITPEGRNVLRGISRDYIFDLCKELDIPCIEKNIDRYDVICADEAFMTGTPFCLLPVTRLDNNSISDGGVGNIYTAILNQWSKNVNLDIKSQIEGYSDLSSSPSLTPYSFK